VGGYCLFCLHLLALLAVRAELPRHWGVPLFIVRRCVWIAVIILSLYTGEDIVIDSAWVVVLSGIKTRAAFPESGDQGNGIRNMEFVSALHMPCTQGFHAPTHFLMIPRHCVKLQQCCEVPHIDP
jgi:hypothetical protein